MCGELTVDGVLGVLVERLAAGDDGLERGECLGMDVLYLQHGFLVGGDGEQIGDAVFVNVVCHLQGVVLGYEQCAVSVCEGIEEGGVAVVDEWWQEYHCAVLPPGPSS